MARFRLADAQRSLRARLFAATVLLLGVAVGVAAVGFEHAARRVVLEALRSHLDARAHEVLEATARFQREREITARGWAEAEAMQLSLDSGDPKFAEDFLKRAIQDQGGAFAVAALLDPRARVVCAVHAAAGDQRRGTPLEWLRGRIVELAPSARALREGAPGVAVLPVAGLGASDGESPALVLAAPVKDFAGDVVGAVVGVVSRAALGRLLADIAGDRAYVPVLADAELRLVTARPGEAPATVAALLAAGDAGGRPGLEAHTAAGARWLGVRTAPQPERPGWSAIMALPEAQAFGTLRRLHRVLVAVFAAVLVGASVASVAALRQAAQPLIEVSSSMARVAGGDLTTRLPEGYRDDLGRLVHSFNAMVSEVARSHEVLKRTEALRREMQIAQALQTGVLPRSPAIDGFEVAARMKPAENVGGDLYDILSFRDTFWLLIGDVSGHGLQSGLVMLMAQAAASSAIASRPDCTPREVLAAVNRVVHENVRRRMRRDDYLTLMVARHAGDGRFVAAGAHQPLFLLRAAGGVEVLEPAGPWCGVLEDVAPCTAEYEFRLGAGDLLCLITDGVVEARGPGDELYGADRLAELLARPGGAGARQVLDAVFASVEGFAVSQDDDMTALVLKRKEIHARA